MSRVDKAKERLKSKPRDFTWQELQMIMGQLGYVELKGGGSRRKFFNEETKALINLHEPHPQPVLKRYAIEIVLEHLKERNLL